MRGRGTFSRTRATLASLIRMRLAPRSVFRPIALLLIACVSLAREASAQRRRAPSDRTVVLIVADGLRWQEVFTGADSTLMNSAHGGIWLDSTVLRTRYWRSSGEDRRAALFPFLWKIVATRGQIFGNQAIGSVAHVTNENGIFVSRLQ